MVLVDLRDAPLNKNPGAVDSVSGDFVVYYPVEFGSIPNKLLAQRSGCKDQSTPITKRELHIATGKEVSFRCDPS